ncbi:chloride channel protein [Pararhizobium haloflavum]|uniref:chloride channel protein n=1 Tax=Pararhizobium haloflavum TaxID=2037914 RepID=UPI000C18E164|nr:chloride channel protein [Pararhizobium haloflavum]
MPSHYLLQLPALLRSWIAPNVRAFRQDKRMRLWVLSLAVGIGVAIAAIAFREGIGLVQLLWLGDSTEHVLSATRRVPWYVILAAPAAGGLVVGLMLQFLLPSRRPQGVADVIETRAITGRQIGFREGILSSIATVISLGAGASAGREGPVVHLGATLASGIGRHLALPEWNRRTLLGAGVAAAISASFNAPIAGVLFAHEVILGHYAMRSFVPIVIASSVAGVMSRLHFGDSAAFLVPAYNVTSYWEFPAFALLGVVAAIVAVGFQFALFSADYLARLVTIPLWLRPVVGGMIIGAIAVFFPQILGVGYEVTDMALWGQLSLVTMLTLIVVKAAATAITLASRFGGGIFSPSLYLGAMTGGAFGIIAASLFPDLASSQALYSILGMGAVAGAVLGAPISTTMIVFELTGGYALSVALLLSVAIAHGMNQAIHGRSYFHWQLELRGLFVQDGPHNALKRNIRVMDFMEPVEGEAEIFDEEKGEAALKAGDTLDKALRLFDTGGHSRLPVLDDRDSRRIIAWATQIKALEHYNRRLIAASEEEHR